MFAGYTGYPELKRANKLPNRVLRPVKLWISGQTLDRANSFPRLHFVDQNRSWELIWAFGAIDSKALSVGPHCS